MDSRPYEPSWIDRLTAAIESLPVPSWLFYLMLAAPLTAAFILVQVWQGAYVDSGFVAWHLFIPIQLIYGIAAIHYIDHVADHALKRFRSVMVADEQLFEQARYRLLTMPARPALLAGLAGAIFAGAQVLGRADPATTIELNRIAATAISLRYADVNIILVWVGYGSMVYHSFHQLRVINWLYTSQAEIDPLHPEPLYALSEVTSQTAIVILVIGYGWFMVITGGRFSELPEEVMFYVTMSIMFTIDFLVFALPLWGAHQLLVEAKIEALAANTRSYKTAVAELHRTVLAKVRDEIDVWNKALSALDIERRHLRQLATWPWSPGALRNLLVAIFVPLLIWVVQFALQQVLR